MKANISMTLTQEKVTARYIASKNRIPNAKSNDRSRTFITSLATKGFGDMVPGSYGSLSLKRKRVNEMDHKARNLFHELGIDEDIYNAAVDQQANDVEIKAKKIKLLVNRRQSLIMDIYGFLLNVKLVIRSMY